MSKFSEVPVSLERVLEALSEQLPASSRVRLLERTVLPGSTRASLTFLELRVTMIATKHNGEWDAARDLMDETDRRAFDWLTSWVPAPRLFQGTPGGRA